MSVSMSSCEESCLCYNLTNEPGQNTPMAIRAENITYACFLKVSRVRITSVGPIYMTCRGEVENELRMRPPWSRPRLIEISESWCDNRYPPVCASVSNSVSPMFLGANDGKDNLDTGHGCTGAA